MKIFQTEEQAKEWLKDQKAESKYIVTLNDGRILALPIDKEELIRKGLEVEMSNILRKDEKYSKEP